MRRTILASALGAATALTVLAAPAHAAPVRATASTACLAGARTADHHRAPDTAAVSVAQTKAIQASIAIFLSTSSTRGEY